RLNNQTMMGKDYQLVHTDQDDAIDALIYPSRSAVSGSAPSMRVDYSYDSADRLSSVTIPSVGTTTYTYDIKSSGETNTVSYPGQPNAMQKTMSSFAEITGINHADGWSETNGYDLFGNITSQKRGGATYGTFAYDKLSRIKEETIQGNTRQYAYDRRGNRQAYANAPADSTRSYELKHDLLNRLTEYKDDKGTTTYTYYPGGLRATKQQTGAVTDTTHYVYLNGQVIEELTQDGRVKARNVFGNQLIWRKDYTTNQEGTYYYNSHGDVVKIKGPSGNVLNTYEYDIWGNLLADKVKEAMPNPFAYAGEMYDKESGFYYLRARYYDPKMGRFISEDTYKGQVDNPLSLNRFTYVYNNPLRYLDPSGHAPTVDGNIADPSAVKSNSPSDKKYVTADQLKQLNFKNVNDNMVNGLNHTLNVFDITTPNRIRHFLSQVMQESGLGQWTKELGNEGYFQMYEPNTQKGKGLGNLFRGDGFKFRGAGFIQMTGRSNYQRFADFMQDQNIMQGADYVAENYAWEAAGFWWMDNNMNKLIDSGASVKQVTKRINGGYMHLEMRELYYQLVLTIIK
ncbi:MAG: RHS repeat-associated core domain-containing protein, partial [Bacillota bacterium]